MIDGKETVKRAEMLLALREKHGLDVVDLALWMAPQVPDAIMSGRHEIVISKVHPSQVRRLIACLSDLNFAAEELPADPAEAVNYRQDKLTRVIVRW